MQYYERNRERWINTLEDQETGRYGDVSDNDEIAISFFEGEEFLIRTLLFYFCVRQFRENYKFYYEREK